MTHNNALRARFTDGALMTASGPKVVTMAFDRLARDLSAAIDALEAKDLPRAHEQLSHAQDLVHELLGMLDTNAWEHAPALAAIYRYVIDLLTTANVYKRVAEVREARHLLGEIGDAFQQASVTASAGQARLDGPRDFSVRA